MAVCVCPWMGGQIFAPGKICTSTIHGGRIAQGAKDGGVRMSMDGLSENKSKNESFKK